MIQLSQIPTSQPYMNELKTLLQFTMKKYGRYQYNVLKNLIITAAFSSMIESYVPFSHFMEGIKETIYGKGELPTNMFYMVSRLKYNNATVFGINITTVFHKTTLETYIETLDYFITNIQRCKDETIYKTFIHNFFKL